MDPASSPGLCTDEINSLIFQMETYGVFDGGEGGEGQQRGQFIQVAANRSAVVSTQPRGPRPAAQDNLITKLEVSDKII